MKKNTKRILVWLYSSEKKVRWVSQKELNWLIPDLTEAGLRSSLYFLEKKEYVRLSKAFGEVHVSLTSHGEQALGDEFPVFSLRMDMWKGDWSVLIFLSAPKGDKNFRYLRQRILRDGFLPLSRGVFVFPGDLGSSVRSLLNQLYRGSVAVLRSDKWQFGDEIKIIGQESSLHDLKHIYSSISKQIHQVIEKKEGKKSGKEQIKTEICSIYSRLFDCLEIDTGILEHYFPQVLGLKSLLSELQQVV